MPSKSLKKIFVAMSGGVDSSVAAALLKKEGHNIVGIFMKFWSGNSCFENRCCSSESETRARLIAKQLKIPFYVFNFEKEFKKEVVNYFLKKQKAGLTPNPCVVCNKEIKFGLLFKKLSAGENEHIATGHYARSKNGKLYMAKDKNKDQSYFLWKLQKKAVKKSLFPMGDYKKSEVRNIAKKMNLPTAGIPDSQEICFIEKTTNDFLRTQIRTKPGKILDSSGNILGKHEGLWFYTIGQRKGIGLSGGPYYVIKKDIKNNVLVVSKNKKDLLSGELKFNNSNWILKREPKFPIEVRAKIRYSHKPAKAVINNKNHLIFKKPQKAITPGQSVVFYVKDELIGGGIIRRG